MDGDRIDKLRKLIESKRAIAFIGAGVSVRAGYPGWSALLQELAEESGKSKVPWTNDSLWDAEEVRQAFARPENFRRAVGKVFAPIGAITDEAVLSIVKMPFRHFITTNYDDVIERAYKQVHGKKLKQIDWDDEPAVRDFITTMNHDRTPASCLHIHGSYDRPETIVLTDSDYSARYVDSMAAHRKLFAIFATQRVVFFGFSMTDPAFDELLRVARRTLGSGDARHFAVLGVPDPNDDVALRRRLNQKYDIEPIPIDNGKTKIEESFRTVIEQLAGKKKATATAARETTKGDIDPADPNKGQFGGKPVSNGRQLSATVTQSPDARDWFRVELEVRPATAKDKPVRGPVIFQLHPTFAPSKYTVDPDADGVVRDTIWSWGAFTIGATLKEGNRTTKLELDLADESLVSAPAKFRAR